MNAPRTVAPSPPRELRTCRGCGKQDFVLETWGQRRLFKYGVRHYAHASCLIGIVGHHGILALPVHVLRDYPVLVAQKAGFDQDLVRVLAGNKVADAWLPPKRKARSDG